MSGHVFISHSSKDDGFVKELREALEGLGLSVWADSRELVGGAKLAPKIEEAIETASHFVAVLSPAVFNSPWVRREIRKALAVEARRGGEGYRVIPLLLPGVEPSALPLFFGEEPVGVRVEVKAGGLNEALPALLAALGERRPDDQTSVQEPAARRVAELKLKLKNAAFEQVSEGVRRAAATAQLLYDPADATRPEVESREFKFVAPLGPIEADRLRWYLESYYLWPTGIFTEQARHIEAQLPKWGGDLYRAATVAQSARELLSDWKQIPEDVERRFSVYVDDRLPEGHSEAEQAAANEAASALLSLPWELLHDGRTYLFHGSSPVRVRRCLPKERPAATSPTSLPIRILLVSPRSEDERAAYIDHRMSARPLIEALEGLGGLVALTVLMPPTFPDLQEALRKAHAEGKPYHVIHFDGHGVYDREHGLGALCFEDPKDAQKLERRASELIYASPPKEGDAGGGKSLADLVRDYRIPLVFLEACQTATTEDVPTASVAATLLDEGVASIVAMSHSVLVETARRFVKAFYGELAAGRRVGTAMLAGQQALYGDTYRGKLMGAGDFRLQDWFVPVLYQEEQDAQLVTRLPSEDARQLQTTQRRLSLGHLPELPHEFQGRSRELLKLERLLAREPYAVIRGRGGEGKTTLAVELARWLVRTSRFRRAAFVSFEQYTDARQMLISIGRQLLPEGDKWHVGQDEDLKTALQPVARALRDRPTVIVLDNLESVLPDQAGQPPPGAAPLPELFDLCRKLLDADPATRIVFTTREPLPAPFDRRGNEIALGALAREDAVALVGEVLKQEGLTPKADDPGGDPKEITDLVEAVDRHARALVLLARELARGGVRATTDNLRRLMADLDRKHPGDRENSLYASLELSLRRLPPATREQLKPLAAFHGGAHLYVLGQMLGAEPEAVMSLAHQLIEVGLAANMGNGHLRLDPALPAYLLRELSEAEQEELRAVWVGGMVVLTNFLYAQWFKDVELSSRLTLLELPNLLSMLTLAQDKAAPEAVVGLARTCGTLFSFLGLRQALAQATKVREKAAEKLGEWSHAWRLTESANIDRLLERGEVRAAYAAAEALLKRCLSAGEGAYANAGYDIACVQWQLGRVLQMGGAAEAALAQLGEAGRRFQVLADAGNTSAAGMASTVMTESGDCLADLGRLNEAAAAYEESIRRSEALDDKRGVAVSKGQLGTTRRQQQRYAEALEIYDETRRIFESLNEPTSVSVIWHQIGIVYRETRQFEQSERAYRQSLAISVQQKDLAGEAASLGELGTLYSVWGRLEEAAKCFRQAADIYVRLNDENHEGTVRNNLAFALFQMQQYDEARRELLRAIECKEPYGHAAELWKTWDILHDLEQASGNAEAAARARARAVESYLAYRRASGQSMELGAQLCAAVAQAIERGETAELEQRLTELSGEDVAPSAKVLFAKVQAILRGERDGALAADPELNYRDAVELQLLLEALGSG